MWRPESIKRGHAARVSWFRRIVTAALIVVFSAPAQTQAPAFGPSNPFYVESALPFHAPVQSPDVFEKSALELDKKKLLLAAVPTRYRSSCFEHIRGGGYAAGYYGYPWSEMLDDDAHAWFTQHSPEATRRILRLSMKRGAARHPLSTAFCASAV